MIVETKYKYKQFNFLPKFLYLIIFIFAIIPFLILIFSAWFFLAPLFLFLVIIYFCFWIGKLDRNFASDMATIGFFISFLIIIGFIILVYSSGGEGEWLIIAALVFFFVGLITIGSFIWLIIAFRINKNYKILIIFILCIIISFLLFYFGIGYLSSAKDKRHYEKALIDRDFTSCNSIIYDIELKDKCMIELIRTSKEGDYKIGICDEIDDDSKKSECKETLLPKNDRFIYNRVKEDVCDADMCNEIVNDSLKVACYKLVDNISDEEFFNKSSYYGFDCCQHIKNEELKNNCCQQFRTERLKNECLKSL